MHGTRYISDTWRRGDKIKISSTELRGHSENLANKLNEYLSKAVMIHFIHRSSMHRGVKKHRDATSEPREHPNETK